LRAGPRNLIRDAPQTVFAPLASQLLRAWKESFTHRERSLEEAIVINLGANVTVFLLFFGIALLDAVRARDVIAALLWVALGLVFLRADALKPKD
jgi:hypothetical protein